MNGLKYVGIGITNPTALFQIRNGGKFKISPIDNDYAQIGLNDIDTNTNTKIYLNGGENKRIEYSASSGGHIFYTNNSNEQMRINNSGNISIGNTSDIYKVNINGSLYSSNSICHIASPLGLICHHTHLFFLFLHLFSISILNPLNSSLRFFLCYNI